MKTQKRSLLNILGFIVLGMAIAAIVSIQIFVSKTQKPSVVNNLASIGKSIINDRDIHIGMSYKEVEAIINREGDKWYKKNTNNNKTIMLCQWVNNNGSRLLALFEEDKLVQKEIFIPQSISVLLLQSQQNKLSHF